MLRCSDSKKILAVRFSYTRSFTKYESLFNSTASNWRTLSSFYRSFIVFLNSCKSQISELEIVQYQRVRKISSFLSQKLEHTETSMWNSKVIIQYIIWLISGQKYWTISVLFKKEPKMSIYTASISCYCCLLCQLKKLIIIFYTPCRWFSAMIMELHSHWK